jgi:hypothetical protein
MARPFRFLVFLATLCGFSSVGRAAVPWLNVHWHQRLEITAKPALIDGSEIFVDFALLLKLNGTDHASVFANAKADGSDLTVTSGDGITVLGHEIVSYDRVSKGAEIWFRAPFFSGSYNRFYLYFGNPDTTIVRTPGEAWTNQQLAVYHFSEDPGQGVLKDFGPHNNFGTTGSPGNWTSADVAAGQIGQGWRFNGQTSFIDGSRISSTAGSYTISAWFACFNRNVDANFAFDADFGHVSAKRNGEQQYPDIVTGNGFIRWDPALPDTLIHHYVWTLDAVRDSARFYFDGIEQGQNVNYAPNPPYKVYTGGGIHGNVGIAGPVFENDPLDMMEGITDEYHIYQGIRSPAWIKTEYRNQKDPANFFTYRQDTWALGADPLTPSLLKLNAFPNPLRGMTEITIVAGPADVEIAVYDIAGHKIRLLRSGALPESPFRLNWDGRDEEGRSLGNGTYFIRAFSKDGVAITKVALIR